MIGLLLAPKFWWSIGLQIAMAPTQDFFEMLDARPPQTGPPTALSAAPPAEDAFAMPHKAAA